MQYDVVIIGAGAAGLMAARELSKAGKRVLILEARDRIGGRIYPLSEKDFGYEAMGGAEFVHGDAPITKALIKEIGLTLDNPQEWWAVRDGAPTKIERVSPHDPLLEEALKKLNKDIPIKKFLDTYFGDDSHAFLRTFVTKWVEGYDAADISRASSFTLRDEMLDEGNWLQMNLKEGYGEVIRFLQKQCETNGVEIFLQKEVVEVDMTGTEVVVKSRDRSPYNTKQLIVTVPLPLLKEIEFKPDIKQKLTAAEQIGFGGIIKILLRFKTKWWIIHEELFEKMFFLLSDEVVPTWWTQYPEPRTVLTGWLPGPSSKNLLHVSDEEILEISLTSLSNIFKLPVEKIREELTNYKIVNWPKDLFARGAYSYGTPESKTAIEELLKPVGNKLFIAGEAVYEGEATGTVEAAFASGIKAAEQILSLK